MAKGTQTCNFPLSDLERAEGGPGWGIRNTRWACGVRHQACRQCGRAEVGEQRTLGGRQLALLAGSSQVASPQA